MEPSELNSLIGELEKIDSSISKVTMQAFIDHSKEGEVLNAFVSVLSRGARHVRVKVVDILSDIHSQQAFELLFYALHDPYRDVRERVIDNLKKGKNNDMRLPPEYQKILEALQREIHGTDDHVFCLCMSYCIGQGFVHNREDMTRTDGRKPLRLCQVCVD